MLGDIGRIGWLVMASTRHLPLVILVLLLVISNAFWAYAYFTSIQRRDDALREGSTTLAIILANIGALLKEATTKDQGEYLGVAYMLTDHALLVAQTLDKLSDSGWTRDVVNAVASLHDLLASTYQGYTIGRSKLMEVGNALEKLAGALRNLDIESIERYSQMLETSVSP